MASAINFLGVDHASLSPNNKIEFGVANVESCVLQYYLVSSLVSPP